LPWRLGSSQHWPASSIGSFQDRKKWKIDFVKPNGRRRRGMAGEGVAWLCVSLHLRDIASVRHD
jgi:hypothetical protein